MVFRGIRPNWNKTKTLNRNIIVVVFEYDNNNTIYIKIQNPIAAGEVLCSCTIGHTRDVGAIRWPLLIVITDVCKNIKVFFYSDDLLWFLNTLIVDRFYQALPHNNNIGPILNQRFTAFKKRMNKYSFLCMWFYVRTVWT